MHAIVLVAILASALAAQATSPHVVLTDVAPGSPRTLLLEVDPVLGTAQPLGGFPAAVFEPLAITIDPFDDDLLVALDQGLGQSLVIRLTRFAGALVETPVAVIPGRVTELAVVAGDLLAAVDGGNGGVYRMPRRGGTATLAVAQPNLTAMQSFGPEGTIVMLAWTGLPGTPTPDSGTGLYDLGQQQFVFGPDTFPNPNGRVTTGVIDLPTAVPRQLLSFGDGSFALFAGLLGQPPQTLTTAPPVPVSGAVAMHPSGTTSTTAVAIGGAAFPFLYTVEALSGTVTLLSSTLPGAPVDFVPGPDSAARSLGYGATCGSTQLAHSTSGLPQLGSTLSSVVTTGPGVPVLLVGGLDDYAFGGLPAVLPGGCLLEVDPEVVLLEVTSPTGFASRPLVIPASPLLVGTVVHLQWVHFDPTGLSTSSAFAHRVGL